MDFIKDFSSTIPAGKQKLLEKITARLSEIHGVQAVVLGGSYARGMQTPLSDLDLGIYYFDRDPFDIAEIRKAAAEIAVRPPTVTGLFEWGRWVNGGAWIHTSAGKMDFLYRSLDQVRTTISNAMKGITDHDYNQQPAYGFYSVIYLAETQACIPLFDPRGLIAELKGRVEPYPPKLKERIVADELWSAEFTLLQARGFAYAGDIYSTAGCLARAAASLVQVLYALNERYFSGDKKAIDMLSAFYHLPQGFVAGLGKALAHIGETPDELSYSVSAIEGLWRSVVALAEGNYHPRFKV